jgi:hypothetical protein
MPRKRGRPRKPIEAPFFTQSIVRAALLEARTTGNTDQVRKKIYAIRCLVL